MKWFVTLTDRLGPEILTVLEIKGQVLHRVGLHVKVPGWLLNLNALLTKKLHKFLSHLNEMSGGRENVFSFGIIAENFEVFENDIFDCKVLWVVGKCEWYSHLLGVKWILQDKGKKLASKLSREGYFGRPKCPLFFVYSPPQS